MGMFNWLVVSTHLKNMSSSVGMMTFPSHTEKKKTYPVMFLSCSSHHQPDMLYPLMVPWNLKGNMAQHGPRLGPRKASPGRDDVVGSVITSNEDVIGFCFKNTYIYIYTCIYIYIHTYLYRFLTVLDVLQCYSSIVIHSTKDVPLFRTCFFIWNQHESTKSLCKLYDTPSPTQSEYVNSYLSREENLYPIP